MRGRFRIFVLAVVVLMLDAPAGRAADLDRSAVDFTPPSGMGPATATPAEKR
jgi:hypothetical protein